LLKCGKGNFILEIAENGCFEGGKKKQPRGCAGLLCVEFY